MYDVHAFDPRLGRLFHAMSGRRHGRYSHRGGAGWGAGPDDFPGFGLPRRRRMRRGDVRAALLVLLSEGPRNGYALMQEIETRSEGMWKPSPGSVYPALSQLEDEGLIRAEEIDGRKAYRLTGEGETYVHENREKLGSPWKGLADHEAEAKASVDLRQLIFQIGGAMAQLVQAGDEAQLEKAREVLVDTRKALYRILAEEE